MARPADGLTCFPKVDHATLQEDDHLAKQGKGVSCWGVDGGANGHAVFGLGQGLDDIHDLGTQQLQY